MGKSFILHDLTAKNPVHNKIATRSFRLLSTYGLQRANIARYGC